MNHLFATTQGGWKHQSGRSGVHNDSDTIVVFQLINQKVKGPLYKRKLRFFIHGTRNVDEEYKIYWLPFGNVHVGCTYRDLHQPMSGLPEWSGNLRMNGHWMRRLRRSVAVA